MALDNKDKESGKAGGSVSSATGLSKPVSKFTLADMRDVIWDSLVELVFDNLPAGMKALGERIKAGDITIFKFVMELLDRFEDKNENPRLVVASFAELMMAELKSLPDLPAETADKAGVEAPASA